MKPKTFANNHFLILLLITGVTIGLISWDHQQISGQFKQSLNDTTPKKPARPAEGNNYQRDKKVSNLDDVLNELNAADMNVNMDHLKKELAEVMKGIDQEKINMDIEKALAQVDIAKIQKEISEFLAKVDFSNVKKELAETMKNIDIDKIQKEVKASLAKIDYDKIRADLEKAKNIDWQHLEKEMKDLGPKLEKDLNNAKVEIEKAKKEIKEYKNFVDDLDKEGLLNKKEGYSLKHKNGDFFINGKKVTQKTYNKYRSFLEKHKQFNIVVNNNDDLKFDID